MSKLRAAVIGLGMGKGHIQGYQSHPDTEVVAIADLDEARLAKCAEDYKIPKTYTDPAKMFAAESIDVVSIATPNKFHKPLTIQALEAGCHVLCEKPMAMNAVEAQEMLAVAKRVGKRVMINFSFRFNDMSWALKKHVDAGVLGDVYYARTQWLRRRGMPGFGGWFGTKALAGGGPLIDLGVHRLDLALWMMGYPTPVWVMAGAYDHIAKAAAAKEGKSFDVEDLASGMIQFSNGATLHLTASWAGNTEKNEEMETRLFGTKAGLVQRNVGEGYEFEGLIFQEINGTQVDMKIHRPVADATSAMVHFCNAIINNTPHTATGEEGLTIMKLLDALYESAEKRTPIKVN